jgi:hypothetical protein
MKGTPHLLKKNNLKNSYKKEKPNSLFFLVACENQLSSCKVTKKKKKMQKLEFRTKRVNID